MVSRYFSFHTLGSAFIVISFIVSQNAYALSGQEIMAKNEDAQKLSDVFSKATLTTGGGGSAEKVKRFSWWRKLKSDQTHFNTLTRFHLPAEVRGEGILFLENGADDNEVLLYLPNYKKIRRVESQQQSGSFMGSELSYSDIATPHVEDYKHKLVQTQPCPGEEKIKCFQVESTPASDAVKERTGYSKSMNWVREDNFMGVKSEMYNLEGVLFKKSELSGIKIVDQSKKKWMAHQIRIENLKSGRFTILSFSDVKANQGLQDNLFTQQNLSKGR